jgi:hypothetical protein
MPKSYSDYIKTGQMDHLTAIKNNTVRTSSKNCMHQIMADLAGQGLPADAGAFGALDAVAVKFVEWYGPKATGEIFRHYGAVCERQPVKTEGSEA